MHTMKAQLGIQMELAKQIIASDLLLVQMSNNISAILSQWWQILVAVSCLVSLVSRIILYGELIVMPLRRSHLPITRFVWWRVIHQLCSRQATIRATSGISQRIMPITTILRGSRTEITRTINVFRLLLAQTKCYINAQPLQSLRTSLAAPSLGRIASCTNSTRELILLKLLVQLTPINKYVWN
jgi:hypothetical protein